MKLTINSFTLSVVFFLTAFISFGQKNKKSIKLPVVIEESSGLVFYNDTLLISHNDSGDKPLLYFFTLRGKLVHTLFVENAINEDWEDITSDNQGNIYIGDIGNNNNKRRDLKIYKISGNALLQKQSVRAEVISYNYENQLSFPPAQSEQNFDAEGLAYYNDSLWIFTKCRTIPFEGNTYIYKIPTKPGNYELKKAGQLFIGKDGFMKDAITAATICKNILYLNTYNRFLMYDIQGNKITFLKQYSTMPYSQKEALITKDNKTVYLTDEVAKFLGGGYLYNIELK